MKRLALLAILVTVLVGCDEPDPEEPWEGEPDRFEPDDFQSAAKSQRIHARSQFHTFSPDGDVDFIRFRVTEPDLDGYDSGQSAMLQTGPFYQFLPLSAVGAVQLQILDWQGAIVKGPSGALEHSFFMDPPGIYYLQVEASDGAGGEYNMLVTEWVDSGNPDLVATSVEVPTTVDVDSTHNITLRVGNQANAPAGSYQLIPYLSADRKWDAGDCEIEGKEPYDSAVLGYFDPNGVVMDVTFTAAAGSPAPLPSPGPVYVLVRALLASEVDTSDNVAVGSTILGPADMPLGGAHEPDDDIGVVAAGGAVSSPESDLAFWPAGDVDHFKLEHTTAGQWYEIWTDNLRGGADTKVELLTDLGVILESGGDFAVDEDSGPENDASYLTWQITDSGPAAYIIRVTDVNGATGGYDLHVRVPPAKPDLYELNEDIRTWQVLPRDTALDLNFGADDDEDWFVYSVRAQDGTDGGGGVWGAPWEQHTFMTDDAAGSDTDIYVYKANGSLYGTAFDNTTALGDVTTVTANLPAGLYYVCVKVKAGGAGGSCTLTATSP